MNEQINSLTSDFLPSENVGPRVANIDIFLDYTDIALQQVGDSLLGTGFSYSVGVPLAMIGDELQVVISEELHTLRVINRTFRYGKERVVVHILLDVLGDKHS